MGKLSVRCLDCRGLVLDDPHRAVQWRSLPEMLRVLTDPSGHRPMGAKEHFLIPRVHRFGGIPRGHRLNIAGVAIAIAMGGPARCSGCGSLLPWAAHPALPVPAGSAV